MILKYLRLVREFNKIIQRRLRAQYKKLKQEVPNTLVIYSIEFKYTDVDEINGIHDHPTSKVRLPFLHIHFYVIADCIKCNPVTFPNFAKAAIRRRLVASRKHVILNRIKVNYTRM